MFTIRPDQIKIFEEVLREDFEERLIRHLQTCMPDVKSTAWLESQIGRGIREAANFDLQSERDIAAFIDVTCTVLGGFPEGALPRQALAILRSYGADAGSKIDRYKEWAVESKKPVEEPAEEPVG